MVVYKFYLRDAIKGNIFLGVLPERRRKTQRITYESVINWGRKYFGSGKDEDIFFIRTVLEESENRYAHPASP